jgi:hypothetical protein
MGSLNPFPNWGDPVVLDAIQRAFDATWPILSAHETGLDKARIAELSMALSHKLVELVSEGETDPQELRRLALESFSLALAPIGRGGLIRSPQSRPVREEPANLQAPQHDLICLAHRSRACSRAWKSATSSWPPTDS